MGENNFEEFGGDTIRTLATFTLHFTKEFKCHTLHHFAECEVFCRVVGGEVLLKCLSIHIIKYPAKFRTDPGKKIIKPIQIKKQSLVPSFPSLLPFPPALPFPPLPSVTFFTSVKSKMAAKKKQKKTKTLCARGRGSGGGWGGYRGGPLYIYIYFFFNSVQGVGGAAAGGV